MPVTEEAAVLAPLHALGDVVRRSRLDPSATLVLMGDGPSRPYGERAATALAGTGGHVNRRYNRADTRAAAEQLADDVRATRTTLVVGVGGGRVLDVAKYGAAGGGVDYFAVPTSLAHDGIFSPVVSLFDGAGRTSLGAAPPVGALLDVDVLAAAPARTLRAGIGDLLSNITAVMDWRLADRRGADRFDPDSAAMATSAVALFLDSGAGRGRAGLVAGLARALVRSGLAMTVAGTSRPCSGAEHLISHALDRLLGGRARAHGDQVALGTLVALSAHGADDGQTRAVFTEFGLPTAPHHLGLSMEDLQAAVALAPHCRPGRYTILSEPAVRRRQASDLLGHAFRAAP